MEHEITCTTRRDAYRRAHGGDARRGACRSSLIPFLSLALLLCASVRAADLPTRFDPARDAAADVAHAVTLASALQKHGHDVRAIRPPTVPEGTARLRIAFAAGHPDEAVDRLAEAVRPWIAR